ncbi:hypothetical protein D9M68_141120 [compost metagenome]
MRWGWAWADGAGPVALGDLVLLRADFRGAIFNSSVAGIAGIAFALAWTLVVRPFGTQVATRRLVCGGWGDIGENAMGTRTHPIPNCGPHAGPPRAPEKLDAR